MAQLKNSIVDFTNRTLNGYSVEDYFTFDLKLILEHVKTCTDDFFEWYQIQDDDKLERIALELYGDADYWDILLIINGKDALLHMPYNFDTVAEFARNTAEDYVKHISTLTTLPDFHIEEMVTKYEEKFRKENDSYRLMRIVKPQRMQEFIQKAYEAGCFV